MPALFVLPSSSKADCSQSHSFRSLEAASTSFWACSPDGPLDDIERQAIRFRPEDRRGQQLISDVAGRRLPLAHFGTPDSKQVPMYLEDGKLDVSATYAASSM